MRRIAILGSTGSIGCQALEVLRQFPRELRVTALSARTSIARLAEQAREFRPPWVHIDDEAKIPELRAALGDAAPPLIVSGREGLRRIATDSGADLVLVATVGAVGLEPTLAALDRGIDIALANKEVLVTGGPLVMESARRNRARVLPVDSEHNAIFQCLQGSRGPAEIRRLILTCSGGPFRKATREVIATAGPEQTLRHPTWNMGSKISVDSATLMNKGFEVIEAHHLFDLPVEQIEVVVHPESTVHSMVEFVDGSILAQLGPTDMRMPIQHVFMHPERRTSPVAPMDWKKARLWHFEPPDLERFPCLGYAYEAARIGGTMPCVLNGANEVAVAAHLEGRIPCGAIAQVIRHVMDLHTPTPATGLATLQTADAWSRTSATACIEKLPHHRATAAG